jgi:hypothetical protein
LNFDKSASIYKEEEKLGPGQGGGMRWMSSMTGGGGNLYVKENCMLLIRNLWGKSFGKGFVSKLSMEIRRKLELLVGTIV